MFSYYAWQLMTLLVTLIPLVGGMLIALHYRRLSPNAPLIAIGFGVLALLHISSSGVQMYLTNMLMHRSEGGFTTSSYSMLAGASGSVFMLFNLGAWSMILAGLSLTLRDVQNRLWNNQNSELDSIRLNNNASDAYHRQSALEENHVTAFAASPVPPAAPAFYTNALDTNAPDVSPVQPVRSGTVEQPDNTLPLGSSRF